MYNDLFKVTGKLVYEPSRPNMRKQYKLKTLVLNLVYDDLANLYRFFVKQKYGIHLDPPMWGNHITVIRGDEKPPRPELWKAYEGEFMDIEISPHIYKTRNFWTLPVKSKRLHDIRKELGFKNYHEMHLTIGREVASKVPTWTKKQLDYLSDRPKYNRI
jgi:hypothetical protein